MPSMEGGDVTRSMSARVSRCARAVRAGFALFLLTTASGCGTMITQLDGPLFAPGGHAFDWDGKKASPIYSGTRLSLGGVRKSEIVYFWIADLPFCFVADTALLPLTILQDIGSRIADRFGEDEEEVVLEVEGPR